MFSASIASMFH